MIVESTITDHKLITKIDLPSKEIIAQDEFVHRKINQKAKGYRLVYFQNLMEVGLAFKTIDQWYIAMDILTNLVGPDFKLYLDYKQIMTIYNVSQKVATTVLTTLISKQVLQGARGEYGVNPYLIVPNKATDEMVAKAQARWNVNA
jgi:hypothetical protein